MSTYKKKDCLFLWQNEREFHAIEASKRGINVAQVYKQNPSILKAIRRLQISFNIPGISPWLESWKKDISNYKVIIIHANKITPPVVKYIKGVNPEVRIIVWYWNPVEKSVSIDKFPDELCEKWTFDESDSKKYGLNHNSQYYFNNVKLDDKKIEFDTVFVGGDKGRLEKLIEIQKDFQRVGVTSYYHITPTGKINKKYIETYKKRISYSEILNYISRSRSIFDYVSENQSGLTLRPLESLFFKKKLITNDTNIIYRDFYSEENIFVLGKDKMSDLPRFLSAPYKTMDDNIINKYDFDNWLNRFFEEAQKLT